MTDKNGIEIKTGMIVEITGAYFKTDNALYYVEHSPGDPGWCGSDYSLTKISKHGKISTAKNRICFWPIMVTVNGPKYYETKRWNAENAAIEVKPALANMAEVAAHFRQEASDISERIKRMVWDFGTDSPVIKRYKAMQAHWEAVASSLEK